MHCTYRFSGTSGTTVTYFPNLNLAALTAYTIIAIDQNTAEGSSQPPKNKKRKDLISIALYRRNLIHSPNIRYTSNTILILYFRYYYIKMQWIMSYISEKEIKVKSAPTNDSFCTNQ